MLMLRYGPSLMRKPAAPEPAVPSITAMHSRNLPENYELFEVPNGNNAHKRV